MIVIIMFLYIGGIACYIQLFRVLTRARNECLAGENIKMPMLNTIIKRYTDCVNGGIKVDSIGFFVEKIVLESKFCGLKVRWLGKLPFAYEVGIIVFGVIAMVIEWELGSTLFYMSIMLIGIVSIEISRQVTDADFLMRTLVADMADYLENVYVIDEAGDIPVIRMSAKSSREFAKLNKQYRQILKKC